MAEENKISIDTLTGAGKKITLVGREYTILPVNIKDMHYVIGDDRIVILDKKKIESGEVDWQLFGLNAIDEKYKKSFMYIINHYLFYKDRPMTEELLIEHNWSFKEIGQFIFKWCQDSD